MKVVLIDTPTRTVKPVELPVSGINAREALNAVYQLLGIDTGSRLVQGVPFAELEGADQLYVDEEGLLRGSTMALGSFTFRGNGERLNGRGVVIGVDSEGNWVDAITPSGFVERRTQFL